MKLKRIVIFLLIAVVVIAICYWLNDITTPKSCKVQLSQMSPFCKDLLFPN